MSNQSARAKKQDAQTNHKVIERQELLIKYDK